MTAVRGWLCSMKCCTPLLLTHWSQSAPTLLSDLHVPSPIVCGQMKKSDKETRQHLRHVSVSRKVVSVRHAINDWQMEARTWMPTHILSVQGIRKPTILSPVFLIGKINQYPHRMQTDSANKMHPVTSLLFFISLWKAKDYSSNFNLRAGI